MEIVRLTAQDYDEWLYVLNTVFTKQNKKDMDFEKELPRMCVRDDKHMGRHLAVKDGGKICALLGIYPLPVKIGDAELMFSTVGNVATLPEQEGKGYMRMLMQEAMKELERIGADASRLGGVRQRYNRYGYEMCGMQYSFVIDDFTSKYCFPAQEKILFKKITLENTKELEFINFLRGRLPMHMQRSYGGTYWGEFAALCTWNNLPYVAEDEKGNLLGYFSVSKDLKTIAEVNAVDTEALKKILYNWQKRVTGEITFVLSPFATDAISYFAEVAEHMTLTSPCHFKVIHYDKIADALIKQKVHLAPRICNGEKVIGIKDWGNILIYHRDKEAFCKKTDKAAEIVVDKLEASRLLFGPLGPDIIVEEDAFLKSILPLPLGWSTLDRV